MSGVFDTIRTSEWTTPIVVSVAALGISFGYSQTFDPPEKSHPGRPVTPVVKEAGKLSVANCTALEVKVLNTGRLLFTIGVTPNIDGPLEATFDFGDGREPRTKAVVDDAVTMRHGYPLGNYTVDVSVNPVGTPAEELAAPSCSADITLTPVTSTTEA